jgi:hypothetical protein
VSGTLSFESQNLEREALKVKEKPVEGGSPNPRTLLRRCEVR